MRDHFWFQMPIGCAAAHVLRAPQHVIHSRLDAHSCRRLGALHRGRQMLQRIVAQPIHMNPSGFGSSAECGNLPSRRLNTREGHPVMREVGIQLLGHTVVGEHDHLFNDELAFRFSLSVWNDFDRHLRGLTHARKLKRDVPGAHCQPSTRQPCSPQARGDGVELLDTLCHRSKHLLLYVWLDHHLHVFHGGLPLEQLTDGLGGHAAPMPDDSLPHPLRQHRAVLRDGPQEGEREGVPAVPDGTAPGDRRRDHRDRAVRHRQGDGAHGSLLVDGTVACQEMGDVEDVDPDAVSLSPFHINYAARHCAVNPIHPG
mmetsp:Transcript_69333/g.115640  ORF Transcript_69333/g.115640 Transcript_69333/m.115640 type:complete len:313 (+) Transcript_69333:4079-5017(+)